MKAAISQSNYIPWKGYFDLIHSVDAFVLYDDMQYTRRDWRNRNKIQTQRGLQWLSIPVEVKGKYHQKISDTRISDPDWSRLHWKTLTHAYSKAPYFESYREVFERLYSRPYERLSEVNYQFITSICEILGISTRIYWSSEFVLKDDRNERLIHICEQLGATDYVSGPAAKSYMDLDRFAAARIGVHWMDYQNYPLYKQLHEPFAHDVTVLDLLFNTGPNATGMMKSFHGPIPTHPG